MVNIKQFCTVASIALVVSILPIQSAFAYSNSAVLKEGMSNADVSELQNDLKVLGFFSESPTGYFGNITKTAIISFQKRYRLISDGVAGNETILKINDLKKSSKTTSRSNVSKENVSSDKTAQSKKIQLLPWFGKVEKIYKTGDVATVIDIETGLKIQIKRTYGTNHADVETLTAKDTAALKKVAGGSWNWTRRPVIVEIDGYRIAGSLTAMPHAGRDGLPANKVVSNRSGGYGRGKNLDTVKDNDMNGQFDIHFYRSKTHSTGRVDKEHQATVQKAYKSEQ